MLKTLSVATIRTQVRVPLQFADGYAAPARVVTFDGPAAGREHLAFGLGGYADAFTPADQRRRAPLVRPHSQCLTGDVFGGRRCDCGARLPGDEGRTRRHHARCPAGGPTRSG